MRAIHAFLLLALFVFANIASAEVVHSDPSSFLVKQRIIVATDSVTSYNALIHPERWWNPTHTWSGDAKNLSLQANTGGCWCERWPGGEVEHGRVIHLKKDAQLRLQGALGPLQDMAVNAVLDFSLVQGKDGTQIDLMYRVTGADSSQLDVLSAVIDKVLDEQMARLKLHLQPLAPNADPTAPPAQP